MWAENHFSTWMNKDGSQAKAQEHASFVQLGTAPFFDLLFNSSTSPAMLVYLDQRYSYAHRLNENYAREIMELHTLGVKGGYTQKDVTTLADLLTGWTLADEAPIDGSGGDLDRTFGYDTHLNSGNGCRVFGVEFPGTEAGAPFRPAADGAGDVERAPELRHVHQPQAVRTVRGRSRAAEARG